MTLLRLPHQVCLKKECFSCTTCCPNLQTQSNFTWSCVTFKNLIILVSSVITSQLHIWLTQLLLIEVKLKYFFRFTCFQNYGIISACHIKFEYYYLFKNFLLSRFGDQDVVKDLLELLALKMKTKSVPVKLVLSAAMRQG